MRSPFLSIECTVCCCVSDCSKTTRNELESELIRFGFLSGKLPPVTTHLLLGLVKRGRNTPLHRFCNFTASAMVAKHYKRGHGVHIIPASELTVFLRQHFRETVNAANR